MKNRMSAPRQDAIAAWVFAVVLVVGEVARRSASPSLMPLALDDMVVAAGLFMAGGLAWRDWSRAALALAIGWTFAAGVLLVPVLAHLDGLINGTSPFAPREFGVLVALMIFAALAAARTARRA